MTLGQRIQELRKQHNLSQEALGEKLGVSRQAISRWEMDGAVPEVDKLIAMGRLFEVSLNDLLQVEDGSGGEKTTQVVLAPARGWRWAMPVMAVLLAASLVCTGLLGQRVAQLESRLEQEQTVPVQTIDPNAPLVASFDYSFGGQVPQMERMIDCTAALTAAQMVDGMAVTLQLVDGEGQVQLVEMPHAGGSVYSASFKLDRYSVPITCTALLESAGNAHTQPVLRWNSIGPNGWTWDDLLEPHP